MSGKFVWIGMGLAVVVVAIVAAVLLYRQPKLPPEHVAAPVAAQPAPPPEAPAAPAQPFSYSAKNAQAEVSLKLPQSVADEPDLHARLYGEGVKELKKFSEAAVDAHAEDTSEAITYDRKVKWTTAVETGKLLSLRKQTEEYTGGAHPNMTLEATLWDRSTKKALQPAALFRHGADFTALDGVLCQAINAARTAREASSGGSAAPESSDSWPCPKWSASAFVLARSTTAGKAGGLTFLFSPYAIGPYSDGIYEITIPLSAFRSALAPAYADEFGGAPPKVGDTTPQQ